MPPLSNAAEEDAVAVEPSCSVPGPCIVKVLPELVWPYAMMVPLIPLTKLETMPCEVCLYTSCVVDLSPKVLSKEKYVVRLCIRPGNGSPDDVHCVTELCCRRRHTGFPFWEDGLIRTATDVTEWDDGEMKSKMRISGNIKELMQSNNAPLMFSPLVVVDIQELLAAILLMKWFECAATLMLSN